jgi:hypothetical protein
MEQLLKLLLAALEQLLEPRSANRTLGRRHVFERDTLDLISTLILERRRRKIEYQLGGAIRDMAGTVDRAVEKLPRDLA